MTDTAWNQLTRNTLFSRLGSLLTLGWIVYVVSWLTGRPFLAAVGLMFLVLLILWVVVYFWFFAHALALRGRLVLDCGRHPMWWLFLLNAALFLMMSWPMAPASRWPGSLGHGWPVFCIVVSACCLVLAMGRLQVRENGLWEYSELLRWDELESYHWADDAMLILRVRAPLNLRQIALPVPPEHQAEVKAILAKHAPADPLE
jgi:Domain of unknown function (DUF5673)